MFELESLAREAIRAMVVCGCNKAADHMRGMPRIGDVGWVAAWHATLDRCNQDIDHVASGGDNVDAAVNATKALFRALCADHEEARRCASR